MIELQVIWARKGCFLDLERADQLLVVDEGCIVKNVEEALLAWGAAQGDRMINPGCSVEIRG
ncbi:MAG: hypothetical protein HN348_25795 [Proteobacteria bacterium]|jgi:hypothetical protein|nr:hypothetical protein [Pseudomonadota bacterium]